MASRPHAAWSSLPEDIRRGLARGSTGREHLAGLAAGLFAAGKEQAPLARELLCAAWAEAPLSLDVALLLGGPAMRGLPALPEPLSRLVQALPAFWRAPAATDTWWAEGDWERTRASLLERLSAEPVNMFWRAAAWGLAWQRADWELSARMVDPASWPRVLAPVRLQATAQHLLAQGEAAAALAVLDELGECFPGGSPGLRAECLLRLGRRDEAATVLAQAVLAAPWRGSELLRCADLVSGAERDVRPVPGSVAVLLYTWNKAAELDETLASLAASSLFEHAPGARLWVLDNGGADATPDVLERWGKRFGDCFSTVRLPVNIGAPAARNWLLSLPEVRSREFLVFLDDDVSLPADWLGRLGAAAALYPEASVWGCRVVDEANPLVVQSVDYVPLAPHPSRAPDQLLALPTLHLGQPDFGQFRYMRPCVSVTGCCHMLRGARVDATGGFDIRFSPSQYDDLERDLRVFAGGGQVVYQGHLAVRHKRRSGAAAERSQAEIGSAMGNMRKLEAKHGEARLAAISEQGEALLERDMERRFRLLEDVLDG